MGYKTRKYEEGLSGHAPGVFDINEEGRRAKDKGYRDYLRNRDLAEQLRDSTYNSGSGGDSTYPPYVPTLGVRIFRLIVGLALVAVTWLVFRAKIFPDLARMHNSPDLIGGIAAGGGAALIVSLPGCSSFGERSRARINNA